MSDKEIKYEYHHMGIPTTQKREGERYSSTFKMYTSGGKNKDFRIQYHRFEADSPLHIAIQTLPHAAFKVDSIDEAIEGKTVILGPYYPFPGFRVAMILDEESGAPVEFIETALSEEEIWADKKDKSYIYPDGVNGG